MVSADFARELERELAAKDALIAKFREFVARVAKQKPEKPDYWNSCGQCERNISDAEELMP
ncbi:MAG TPA: hypothetical protein VHN11_21205 [Xanthobacteraceae bacterium]|jgi:hypothetical protein|nr:hypothetical protein [Xanthobacteraceae bacterium]